MSNHKQRQRTLANFKFEQMKEGIRKDAVDTATLVMSYASIMYLRDHEGYGKVRLKRFMDYVQNMLNGVGEEYDFEDMIVAIEEETGYKLKLPPRQIL